MCICVRVLLIFRWLYESDFWFQTVRVKGIGTEFNVLLLPLLKGRWFKDNLNVLINVHISLRFLKLIIFIKIKVFFRVAPIRILAD